MQKKVWRTVVKIFGWVILSQPIAGIIFLAVFWKEHLLLGLVFLLISAMGCSVGLGMVRMRASARRELLFWGPADLVVLPLVYLALGETVSAAIAGDILFGCMFTLAYRILPGAPAKAP